MEVKALLGTVSLLLSVTSFVPYLYDCIRRKTQPHAFSWLIWSGLSAINFILALSQHGGAGAWVWGLIAGESLAVFLLSLAVGDYHATGLDYACLLGAGLATLVWLLTKQPLLAAIIISFVQLLGYIPTFRKSYRRPHNETMAVYSLGTLLLGLSVIALKQYQLQTLLYPVVCTLLNAAMMVFLLIRRCQVPLPKRPENRLVYLFNLLLRSHAKRLLLRF